MHIYLYIVTFFTIVKSKGKTRYLIKICVVVHEFHVNPIPVELNTEPVDQSATVQDFISYIVMLSLTNCSENNSDVLKSFSVLRN